MSSPTRVILKAVCLMTLSSSRRSQGPAPADGLADDAGAAHAHVDHHLGQRRAVEGAGHEGVVLHGVGEDHELGAADAAAVAVL